jgi:hypothetical protein
VLPKHRLRARQGQQAWGGSRKWEATLALRGGQAYRECARHGLWRGGAAAQGRRGGRVRCAGAAGSPGSPAALGTGATAAAPSRTRAGRAARWWWCAVGWTARAGGAAGRTGTQPPRPSRAVSCAGRDGSGAGGRGAVTTPP